MNICGIIKRQRQVSGGGLLRKDLSRDAYDLELLSCFFLVGGNNLVEGLGKVLN